MGAEGGRASSSARTTRSAGCPTRTSSRRASTSPRSSPRRRPRRAGRSSCTRRRRARARGRPRSSPRASSSASTSSSSRALDHIEAFERYRAADVVVDQLNAGWYGVFAIEAMALGKPVVSFLHEEAVRRTEEAFGVEVPIVHATKETLPTCSAGSRRRRRSSGASAPRAARTSSACTTSRTSPIACSTSTLACSEARHRAEAARSPLGDLRARRARVAHPRDAAPAALHALPAAEGIRARRDRDRDDRGRRDRAAAGDRERVLPLLLRREGRGREAHRDPDVVLVHDDDVDARPRARRRLRGRRSATGSGSATTRRSSAPAPSGCGRRRTTSSSRRCSASRSDRCSTRSRASRTSSSPSCAMVVFVAVFHWGAVGLVVGNFTGTLAVYVALVVYRSEQLGLEFDTALLRKMQKFGMPLVPSALALWVINWVDREFVVWYKGLAEAGVYSAAVKIASVITFVMIAFRTAWPAFAYSIEDEGEAKRTYCVRPHVPARVHVLGRPRARRARALVDAAPHGAALPARGEGRGAPRVRGRRLRRLHRARDRQRPGAAHAAQLGRNGDRRCRERRAQLLAHPAVGHGRRVDLDRSPRTSSSSSA